MDWPAHKLVCLPLQSVYGTEHVEVLPNIVPIDGIAWNPASAVRLPRIDDLDAAHALAFNDAARMPWRKCTVAYVESLPRSQQTLQSRKIRCMLQVKWEGAAHIDDPTTFMDWLVATEIIDAFWYRVAAPLEKVSWWNAPLPTLESVRHASHYPSGWMQCKHMIPGMLESYRAFQGNKLKDVWDAILARTGHAIARPDGYSDYEYYRYMVVGFQIISAFWDVN